MRDRDIRSTLYATEFARHRHDPSTLIIDELGLAWGAIRVDVAVVNGQIHGYEIKSDADTLGRLRAQAAMYGRVLDRVTLVAGRLLEEARHVVPEWWGLCEAREVEPGRVKLKHVRAAKRNRAIDLEALAMLLWRDEALAILEETGGAAGLRSKPHRDHYREQVRRLTGTQLRTRVREALKQRPSWRAGSPRT